MISILVPFLNEEDSILDTILRIQKFTEHSNNLDFEIILIDDGSTDDSLGKIESEKWSINLKIIKLSTNVGSHNALRAGISVSSGDYVTFIYADLQDPLDNIIKFYSEIDKGYNIVWGYRNETKEPFLSKVLSNSYARIMRRYAIPNFPSRNMDVVMFDRKVANVLIDNVEKNSNIFLEILSFGFLQTNISYDKKERKVGKSKWTLSKKTKLFLDSFFAFSYFPIRMVSILGFMMFVFGLGWSGYLLTRTLIYDDLNSGWPTLISVLSIGFGITNISLGIIAEYLWRTLDSSRKRPVFIIDEVINVNNK